MKKILKLIIGILICFSSVSCSKDEPQVTFTIDYTFSNGNMSRAAEDVYSDYYEKCILTKQNTPLNYNIIFNYENKPILTAYGKWENDNSYCLPTGTYYVTGKSYPKTEAWSCASDSVFISFDTYVDVTLNSKNIIINGNYDCYLLLFKDEDIKSIEIWDTLHNYIFTSNNGYYGIYVSIKPTTSENLRIIKTNGNKIEINLYNKRFEKGKYYYFNSTTNEFFLDKMENGSN